jgi:hypothetical protein
MAKMVSGQEDGLSRHWKLVLLLIWFFTCAAFVVYRWKAIHWFGLGDTDDNMRMMQVRALLEGQGWYDLRQYRLNPPEGADIHWSRFVDLPIATILLVAKPLIGVGAAERLAVTIAPMIPLGVAFGGLAVTARRLVAPSAYILAAGIFVTFITAMTMFMPLRIDHHGWQLAMLTVVLAGLADANAIRGGVTVGVATALSLVIGLETLPWLAVAGAGVGLRWIIDPEQSTRLRGYALALGGGVAAGFLMFASEANRVPRCDALTPVWVSVMLLAASGAFLLSSLSIARRTSRLALATALGLGILIYVALAWPDCLGRPEQVSPELQRLWLGNVSEAKPIYTRNWATIFSSSVFLVGLAGSLWMVWKNRSTERGAAWATIALLSLGSGLLLLWQARAAPTALTFSVPGAVALGWIVIPRLRASNSVLVRVFGTVGAFLLLSGIGFQFIGASIPDETAQSQRMKLVNRANAACPSLPALAPIARLPKATILTFVDLGPRLITVTPHNAVAGPYHRNGEAILDIHRAFRGTAQDARHTARKYGATLLLICPNMSESTLYRVQNPDGFYRQLSDGKVPEWLEPIPLPARSPFRLWAIRG